MTRLTINLPDDLAKRITSMARSRGCKEPEIAVELLRSSIVSHDVSDDLEAVKDLSDDEVIAMADLRLTPEDDARLSELLDLNGEGALTAKQRRELDALMKIHNEALLRKAQGWAEAVRRGLRPPISP
jgi:hypothetical protein